MAQISYKLILLKLILSIVFGLFTFILLPLIVFVSVLFRCIIKLLAKLLRPDLGPILNGMTASIALDKFKKPKYNLTMYFVVDGSRSVDQFRALFEKTVLSKMDSNGNSYYPELKQTVGTFLGYSFRKWESDFQLANHVREYDYHEDLPLGSPCEDEDLRRNFGGLMAKGWPKDFSPWEFLIVPQYYSDSSNPKWCFIVRIHHVLGDGYSITNFIMRDLAQNDFKTRLPRRRIKNLWIEIPKILFFPIVCSWQLADNLVESFDSENCWHTWGKLSKEYHTSISGPIQMEMVKEIKNRFGVSIAAVLHTALCGAIRRVMEDAGQVVPETYASLNPMPVRNHPPGLVNHISLMYIRWPLSTKSAIVRMKQINRNLKNASGSTVSVLVFWMTKCNGLLPHWGQRIFHAKNYCTAITSINPTPSEVPYLMGCEVLESIIAIPLGPGQQGLSVLMMGTGGKLRIVANIEKNVSPPENIFRNLGPYITQELLWLHQASNSVIENADVIV